MSPGSTSKWCTSLAGCRLQGPTLRELQGEITRRCIDGSQFGELLRANALQDWGIEGLNAKLCVAIRKAWNADFAQVTFLPHYQQQPAAAPTHEPYSVPFVAQPATPTDRARMAPKGPPGHDLKVALMKNSGAAPIHMRGAQQLPADQQMHPQFQMQPTFTPMHVRSVPQSPQEQYMQPQLQSPASGPPWQPQAQFQAPPYQPAMPQQSERLGLQAAQPRPFEVPDEVPAGPYSPLAAKGAPKAAAAPQAGGRPPRRKPESHAQEWAGGSLDQVFAARSKAPISLATEATSPSHAAPSEEGRAPAGPPAGPPGGGDWGGVGLGDVLAARPAAKNRYGRAEPEEEVRNPTPNSRRAGRRDSAASFDGPSSLGDVFAPKQAARNRYGAPSADQQEESRPRVSPTTKAADGWQGGSLEDALGPAPPAVASRQPAAGGEPGEQAPQERMRRGGTSPAADPWAGVSLGDALGGPAKPPPAPVAAEPRPTKRKNVGAAQQQAAAAGASDKTPHDILEWLKTLPESHVPEKTREELANIVQGQSLDGSAFTQYVQTVPPEVCAPKHAMKLKAAWKNVMAEAEARAICKQNLEYAAKAPSGKGGVRVDC